MPTVPPPPVEFVGSFPDPLTRLDPPLAEVAFLGRSNVGKSSLINALTGRKDLARVSATPGKTQAMNVFRVAGLGSWVTGRGTRGAGMSAHASGSGESEPTPRDARPTTRDPRPFYLLDLPGYGYARAAKGERARFRSLVDRLVAERGSVSGIIWLLDARHDPSAEDRVLQELLARSGRPVLAVLTKGDKLGRQAQRERTRALALGLGLEGDQVQLTSSSSGDGIADLRESIAALVGTGDPDDR
jgi:GTP-binding protein